MPRRLPSLENWPTTASAALDVQNALRDTLYIHDDFKSVKTIAGVDVAFDVPNEISHAAVVLMDFETMHPLATAKAKRPTIFPYVSGFLSFREIPVILDALAMLPDLPDMLMVDGQGIAHPRRLGIAAHLGLLTDLPAIGVAKSRLYGRNREPDNVAGAQTDLLDTKNEKIGTVLRSKVNCLPLYISAGHRISHDTALDITRHCLRGYRLPEPTRLADKLSKIKTDDASLF